MAINDDPRSSPDEPTRPPPRAPSQRWLGCRLTVQACIGLVSLATAIVGLLSFALWLACGPFDPWMPERVFIALGAMLLAVLLLSWLWRPPMDVGGLELQRGDSPELFGLIDRCAQHYRVRPVDRVLIGSDMNAGVVQLPDLGLWGRLRTTLVIGLPLLHSLSVAQLEAILAHEFSHLALQRRSLPAWAAQLRAWWHRVLIEIEDDGSPVARIASKLLARHADHYLIDAVRLAHLEEFEADAGAASLVGAQRLGEALIEVALKERYLREEYWDAVMNQFEVREPVQPILPFRTMGLGVSLGFRRTEAARRMPDLLEYAPGIELHPRLIERLAALQVAPCSLVEGAPSAADECLGDAAASLALRLDRAWCMALEPCCR